MSDDEELPSESTIGRAIKEQCKLDTEMLGMMKVYILNFPQNKMNLFILSGHAGDSFAAFLNEVIL